MSLSASVGHSKASSTDLSDTVKQIVGRVGKKWSKSGNGSVPQALEEQAYLVQLMLETAHDTGAVELCQTILENFRRTLRTYSGQLANLEQAKTAIPDMVDGVRALQERFMVVVTKYRTLEIEVKYMEAKIDLLQHRNRVFDEFGERLSALYSTSWPRRNSGIKSQQDMFERNIDEAYRELHKAQTALERYKLVHVLLSRGVKALELAGGFVRQSMETRNRNLQNAMRMSIIQVDTVMKQAKFVLPSLFKDYPHVEIFQDGWLSTVFNREQNETASNMIEFFSAQQATVTPFLDQTNRLIESQSVTERRLRDIHHAAILERENAQRKLLFDYHRGENMEGVREKLSLSLDVLSDLDEVVRGFVAVSPSEDPSEFIMSVLGDRAPLASDIAHVTQDQDEAVSSSLLLAPDSNSSSSSNLNLNHNTYSNSSSNSSSNTPFNLTPLFDSPVQDLPLSTMDRPAKGSSPFPPTRPTYRPLTLDLDEEDAYGGLAPPTANSEISTSQQNPRPLRNAASAPTPAISSFSPALSVPVPSSSKSRSQELQAKGDPRLSVDRRPSPSLVNPGHNTTPSQPMSTSTGSNSNSNSSSTKTLPPSSSRQMPRSLPLPPSTSPAPPAKSSSSPTPIPSPTPSSVSASASAQPLPPGARPPVTQSQSSSSSSAIRQSTRTTSPLPPLPSTAASMPVRPNPPPQPASSGPSSSTPNPAMISKPPHNHPYAPYDRPPSSQPLPPPPPYAAHPSSSSPPTHPNQTFHGIMKHNQAPPPPPPPFSASSSSSSTRPTSVRKPSMDQWGTAKVAAATPHKTKFKAMLDKFRGDSHQHQHKSLESSALPSSSAQAAAAAFLAPPAATATATATMASAPVLSPTKSARPKPRFVDQVEIIPRPESDSYPYSDEEDDPFEHPPSPSKTHSISWSKNNPAGAGEEEGEEGEEDEEDEELLADYYSQSPSQNQIHDKARASKSFQPSGVIDGVPSVRTAYVPPSQSPNPPNPLSMPGHPTLYQPKPRSAASLTNPILSSNWQPQAQPSAIPSRGSSFL